MNATEIKALAEALAPLVAQQLRQINERQTDTAFKMSRPRSERKKEWRAAMKLAKKGEK